MSIHKVCFCGEIRKIICKKFIIPTLYMIPFYEFCINLKAGFLITEELKFNINKHQEMNFQNLI